jgi:ADP-ribose pyrophosphatase
MVAFPYSPMIREWKLVDSEIDRDYNVFKIKTVHAISTRTNKTGKFYTIETRDWVNIIAITENQEVVMIRQYRHGSKEVTLEIPGGLVDEDHPEGAALRELLEETGFAGETIKYLGGVNPNPAIFGNVCHTYLVEKAKKVSKKNLDPEEDIEVVLVPVSEISSLLEGGLINHALVVVAFYYYFLKKGQI